MRVFIQSIEGKEVDTDVAYVGFSSCTAVHRTAVGLRARACAGADMRNPAPDSATGAFLSRRREDAHATRFDPADEETFVEVDRRVFANPDDVDAPIPRGYAHAKRGDRASSEADYRRAWALAPYRTRIGCSEGWALLSLGEPACAIEAWQRAAALQGGDAVWFPYTLA